MKADYSLITINGNQHFIEVQRAWVQTWSQWGGGRTTAAGTLGWFLWFDKHVAYLRDGLAGVLNMSERFGLMSGLRARPDPHYFSGGLAGRRGVMGVNRSVEMKLSFTVCTVSAEIAVSWFLISMWLSISNHTINLIRW